MGTVSKLDAARLLDPANGQLSGQARVNAEIFTAVEILGRKLERSESERDRLARRLALIESAATVDEKTGKLYLPVVTEQGQRARDADYNAPRWMVASSVMSSAVALFSLGLVLFQSPPPPALTGEQIAMLEAMKGARFTALSPENDEWKQPSTVLRATERAALPDAAELSRLEKTAEAPKMIEAPAPEAPVPEKAVVAQAETVKAPAASPPAVAAPQKVPEKALEKDAGKVAAKPPGKPPEKPVEKTPEKIAAAPVAPRPDAASAQAAGASEPVADAADIAPDQALPTNLSQLEKRAYQGVPEAQHDLATLYAAGKMVPQDYKRAIYWFIKSAEGGVANSHYNLGVIYQQGLGVSSDMQKAMGWYEKAAELGHPEAMYNLGIAYIEGIGTKADVERGVSYFKRAAKAGVAQAAYNLGVLYESNFIGPIDTDKAAEWYQVAADEGHADARSAIVRLKGVDVAGGEQSLTLADMVEPAAGGDEIGEGDSSPTDESGGAAGDATLIRIQRELIRQGLMPGPADGALTPQMEDAIRISQKRFGMKEDGRPSEALLEKMLQAGDTR